MVLDSSCYVVDRFFQEAWSVRIEPGGLMQLPFILRKDQERKGGLNVKTWRHQQPLAHTEVKSGHKEHPSMSLQEYTPSQVRDCTESGGPDRFPAMGWPMLPWLPWGTMVRGVGSEGAPNVSKGGQGPHSCLLCCLSYWECKPERISCLCSTCRGVS